MTLAVIFHRRTLEHGGTSHLGEHLRELLVGVVVSALGEVALDLVADLLLVQVPRVVRLGVGARRRVGRALDQVDGRAPLAHDLVGEALRSRKHLRVVLGDEVLHDLFRFKKAWFKAKPLDACICSNLG